MTSSTEEIFDSTAYYRFTNDVNKDLSLSLGTSFDVSPGAPNMTSAGAFSSENWQIFFNQGVYFIRNLDWGQEWQLGVNEDDRSVPVMMRSSGEVGMQWTITHRSDGTWRLNNNVVHDGLRFGVASDSTVPVMNAADKGAHWSLHINLSAGRVKDADMLTEFPIAQPTTTSNTPSASASGTGSTLESSQQTKDDDSISTGAIVGIAIGAVLFLAILVLAILYFRRRRRRRLGRQRRTDRAVVESPANNESAPMMMIPPNNGHPSSEAKPLPPPSSDPTTKQQWANQTTTVSELAAPDPGPRSLMVAEMAGDSVHKRSS